MSKSSNTNNIPESRTALDDMKFEIAREMGVNLTKGYNGHLTAKENGNVGGEMVKRMIEDYQRSVSGK